MITIYLWGHGNRPELISVDSIAIYWYLQTLTERNDIEIVFANNTDLSFTRTLPLLKDDIENIDLVGYGNIIEYLMLKTKDNDNTLSMNELLLVQYLNNKMDLIVKYFLYLNHQNYKEYTRIIFTQLLYWPMWYNTPRKYKVETRVCCEDTFALLKIREDTNCDADDSDDGDLPPGLIQSKTFKMNQDKRKKSKHQLRESSNQLQMTHILKDILNEYQAMRKIVPGESIPVDLYYLAHLYILVQLPDHNDTSQIIQQYHYQDYCTLDKYIQTFSSTKSTITIREPHFTELGNVAMSLYRRVPYL
ncbi:hypothetical protein TBLA_0H02530 [Henningerozyma blattae CBS 6284]|uniref:Mitochondrial outer membrane transport complex Sam37/metaxin N-terminal domain-containing protein n=1 Tax=Henningerozyma blattae (strain ATCC 34711 / CBS 6284 / DSM 70876 / NBRC 10599 / NRRL Y-10934 / UCD 77-7) TaxID=1071380 RepID=I2H835_HENB6|nr:hypothetical protein TBLA_0H02530 [Tetrapisispora blattae CBS 6284]CCH62537.1 hypothetical protein TBLA_0H02530 [Tetrapisispora blattae CBS 6284]